MLSEFPQELVISLVSVEASTHRFADQKDKIILIPIFSVKITEVTLLMI